MMYFSVYRSTAHMAFPTIIPIANCTTNVTGPYEGYDLAIDLIDENTPFNLEITCEQGNLISYNYSMADGSEYITQASQVTHTYITTGTYNGVLSLRNEEGEVLVPFTIRSTFPLKPIVNLTLYTEPTEVATSASIKGRLNQGNDITCMLVHGDGSSRAYYSKPYQNEHTLTKTYSSIGDYEVTFECSNPLSVANTTTMISIQRVVSSTALSFNRPGLWVFEVDTVKTLSWTTLGSHLQTQLVLGGHDIAVQYDTKSVQLNNTLFNTIGSYFGWVIIKNDISSSANISFEVRVERPITEAHVISGGFAAAGVPHSACVLLPSGSYAAVEFTFTVPVLTQQISGDFTNGQACFIGTFPAVGVYIITCKAYNNLTVTPGVTNSSSITVENAVPTLDISVFNSSSLQTPIPVNASQVPGPPPATDTSVLVEALKDGENTSITCYSGIHVSFHSIQAECNVKVSGWYNVSVTVSNNVSKSVVWRRVELGDKLSFMDYNIVKGLVAAGTTATVMIRIPNGIGTRAYVNFGDGYVSPGRALVIGSYTPVNHVYTQYGEYNISMYVTNQISSLEDACPAVCIVVQENITGLMFVEPLAFQLGFPIRVNWTKAGGSHLRHVLKFDGSSVGTFSGSEVGGYMDVSNLAVLTLGTHTIYVEAVNDVSGPDSATAQVVIVRPIQGFAISLPVTAVKTNQILVLGHHVDDGTKVTVNLTANTDTVLDTMYYEEISGTDGYTSISFSQPAMYWIYGEASNPLEVDMASPILLAVQNPVVQSDVNITTVDTYSLPVQFVLHVNPTDPTPTNFTIDVSYGDTINATRANFVEHDNKTFSFSHTYPTDGYYTTTITIQNLVSNWSYVEKIMVGIPVSNVSLTASNVTLIVNETLVINASVKHGSNMEITYDFGVDNQTEMATVLAGDLHQTTFYYTRPGVYKLYVVARNSFSQVERILSNLIIVQYQLEAATLSCSKQVYAVGSDVPLTWAFTSGTNVSCELYYAGNMVYSDHICNMTQTITVPGFKSNSVKINEAKLVAWNLVTPKSEVAIPIQIERPLSGLDLVLQYGMWPIRKHMLLTTDVVEGSKMNLSMTFNNSSPEAYTTFPVGEFNHTWAVNRTFQITGFVEVTVMAENLLGRANTSKVIWVQGPIYQGKAEITEADNYKSPAQFRLILNDNDTEPTDLHITCDLGNGVQKNTASFIHAYQNVWILMYSFRADGYYNISINVKNDVSSWDHYQTITVGEYISNMTITVSDYVVSTSQYLVVTVEILRGSNALTECDFGESGEVLEGNITKGEVKEQRYMYTNPGIYHLRVKAWNVFNELIKDHHSVIMAFDMVRGIKFTTPKPAYAIGKFVIR